MDTVFPRIGIDPTLRDGLWKEQLRWDRGQAAAWALVCRESPAADRLPRNCLIRILLILKGPEVLEPAHQKIDRLLVSEGRG